MLKGESSTLPWVLLWGLQASKICNKKNLINQNMVDPSGCQTISFTVSEIRLLYLKLSIRNCGENAADGNMVTIDSI